MSSAPGWVSYVAIVLSAGSLVVSGLTYRAGGPRLRLKASGATYEADGAWVKSTVVNSGRAAVNIEAFQLTPSGYRKPVLAIEGRIVGPDLPYRLEAQASHTWHIDVLKNAQEYQRRINTGTERSPWPASYRLTVVTGNGKRTHAKSTFMPLLIIAASKGES